MALPGFEALTEYLAIPVRVNHWNSFFSSSWKKYNAEGGLGIGSEAEPLKSQEMAEGGVP